MRPGPQGLRRSVIRRNEPRAQRPLPIRGNEPHNVKYLLRERDSRFTTVFDAAFEAEGIQILRSPVHAPRANAICERVIGTLRRELLDKILILREDHARRALTEWLYHYAHSGPRRSLNQLTPEQAECGPPAPINLAEHRIRRRAILGGITHEYWTTAVARQPAPENLATAESYIRASQVCLRDDHVGGGAVLVGGVAGDGIGDGGADLDLVDGLGGAVSQ